MSTVPRPLARSLSADEPRKLHVCTMISNPVRYASRYRLYREFIAQNRSAEAEFWTVEVALGDRPFAITDRDNRYHLQLRTRDELWHKENALNLLFAHVLSEEPGADRFAWVDADVTFARPDWVEETLHQLEHYDVVQMWTDALDVDDKHRPVGRSARSFFWSYYNDPNFRTAPAKYSKSSTGHPGYAWAATRNALDTFGGLIECAIVGGADRHMACGLVGAMERSGPFESATLNELTGDFRVKLLTWQDNAAALRRNVGYVDGTLLHHWHGPKASRKYGSRWRIYTENAYEPDRDIRRDSQGLLALNPNKPKLRDDLRSYLRARREDDLAPDPDA